MKNADEIYTKLKSINIKFPFRHGERKQIDSCCVHCDHNGSDPCDALVVMLGGDLLLFFFIFSYNGEFTRRVEYMQLAGDSHRVELGVN